MKKTYIDINTGEIIYANIKKYGKGYRSTIKSLNTKNLIDYDIFKIVCKKN